MERQMKYAVVIAERNEPDLKATVADIKAKSKVGKVIVVSDSTGQGPQWCRDKGIMMADGFDVVIVMDGHMRVMPGALDGMAQFAYENPNTVSCAMCHHHHEITWEGALYAGAKLVWKSHGKDHSDPQALVGKWRKDISAGQIGCVMGACYAFRRDWYIDGLRRPWQFGTGWGCDEELISAGTWLRGGSVWCLPFRVWHRARNPKEVPYRLTGDQMNGVWANKFRVLECLPMSMNEKDELAQHVISGIGKIQAKKVEAVLRKTRTDFLKWADFMSEKQGKWVKFKSEIMEKETIRPMKMHEARKLAKSMGITVQPSAKMADILDLLAAGKVAELKESRQEKPSEPEQITEKPAAPRANWGANETNMLGKRSCPHCGGTASTIDRTRLTGKMCNRDRVCKCGGKFKTREIMATA